MYAIDCFSHIEEFTSATMHLRYWSFPVREETLFKFRKGGDLHIRIANKYFRMAYPLGRIDFNSVYGRFTRRGGLIRG